MKQGSITIKDGKEQNESKEISIIFSANIKGTIFSTKSRMRKVKKNEKSKNINSKLKLLFIV